MYGRVVAAAPERDDTAPPKRPAAVLEARCGCCGVDLNGVHKSYRVHQECCCEAKICWPCLRPHQVENDLSHSQNGGPTNLCPMCSEPCSNLGTSAGFMDKMVAKGEAGDPDWMLRQARIAMKSGWHEWQARGMPPRDRNWTSMCKDAHRLTKRAAEAGLLPAWDDLAECYLEGLGTPQNLDVGVDCLLVACELGLPEAHTSLGMLYLHGRACDRGFAGLESDKRRAAACFERAAAANDPRGILIHAQNLVNSVPDSEYFGDVPPTTMTVDELGSLRRRVKALHARAADLEEEMAIRLVTVSAAEGAKEYGFEDEVYAEKLARRAIERIEHRPSANTSLKACGELQWCLARLLMKRKAREKLDADAADAAARCLLLRVSGRAPLVDENAPPPPWATLLTRLVDAGKGACAGIILSKLRVAPGGRSSTSREVVRLTESAANNGSEAAMRITDMMNTSGDGFMSPASSGRSSDDDDSGRGDLDTDSDSRAGDY